MRIIYPPSNYQDAESFLKKEILPHIPTEDRGKGFILIIPIEGTEIISFPENVDDIKSKYIRGAYEAITAIKTGQSIDVTNLYIERLTQEMNLDNILSIIPFNIFVPDLYGRAKNFIIDNYDEIRQQFNVERLSDWATINSQELAEHIINFDKATGNRRVYSDDNWQETSDEIIAQAKIHDRAINPPPI